jgi:transcriptional regulator with XRE-family HTH domain
MIGSQDPAVQGRRLRVALRDARQAKRLTQKEVARTLEWSPSKLLRIENGAVSVTTTDLKALLNVYGITEQQRVDELVEMARIAKRQPWATYRDVLTPEFMVYLSYESSAAVLRQFEPLLIPGLIQTEEYARATIRILSASGVSDEVVERRVQARLERQDLLAREDAPQMLFIMDEAAIRRQVGRGTIMIRQLEHLKDMAKHPKVNIQILPFGVGEHPGMKGPFIVLEFPGPEDDNLLYLENSRGDLVSRDDPEDTASYVDTFIALEDLATPKGRLDDVIDRVIAQMKERPSMETQTAQELHISTNTDG